jgi:outer membrane murein-binding lipoprotein Lpp
VAVGRRCAPWLPRRHGSAHLPMTAVGTPLRCSAVPHAWRASCGRIRRTPAASTSLAVADTNNSARYVEICGTVDITDDPEKTPLYVIRLPRDVRALNRDVRALNRDVRALNRDVRALNRLNRDVRALNRDVRALNRLNRDVRALSRDVRALYRDVCTWDAGRLADGADHRQRPACRHGIPSRRAVRHRGAHCHLTRVFPRSWFLPMPGWSPTH